MLSKLFGWKQSDQKEANDLSEQRMRERLRELQEKQAKETTNDRAQAPRS